MIGVKEHEAIGEAHDQAVDLPHHTGVGGASLQQSDARMREAPGPRRQRKVDPNDDCRRWRANEIE